MGKHYTIDGVATVSGKADGMGVSPLPPIPASITMDTAGIDLFHTVLQIVYAHLYSPYRVTAHSTTAQVRENRKAALAFLVSRGIWNANGARRVRLDVTHIDSWISEYLLTHTDRLAPIIVRLDPREGLDRCVAVKVPSGVFVHVIFDRIVVPPPPR